MQLFRRSHENDLPPLNIPSNWGRVIDSRLYNGSSPTLVYVPDSHASVVANTNIAKIYWMLAQGGNKIVGCEGYGTNLEQVHGDVEEKFTPEEIDLFFSGQPDFTDRGDEFKYLFARSMLEDETETGYAKMIQAVSIAGSYNVTLLHYDNKDVFDAYVFYDRLMRAPLRAKTAFLAAYGVGNLLKLRRLAKSREPLAISNVMQEMERESEKQAIFVMGSLHRRRISHILRQRRINHYLIEPNGLNETSEDMLRKFGERRRELLRGVMTFERLEALLDK